LVLFAAACAVLVAAAGTATGWIIVQRGGEPTTANILPAVERLTAQAVTATTATGAVAAVNGLTRVDPCRTPSYAAGGTFEQSADLYVAAGGVRALVTHLAHALPAATHPHITSDPAGYGPGLTANAGHGIRLLLSPFGPGWLRLTTDTSCLRVAPLALFQAAIPTGARTALVRIFTALHEPAGAWQTAQLPCPHGGTITTLAAASPPHTAHTGLPHLLHSLLPATGAVDARPDHLAYHAGTASVVVGISDDDRRYTAQYTTACNVTGRP
jgi:hypothetical protein